MQAIGAGYGAHFPPPTPPSGNRSAALVPPGTPRGVVQKAKSTNALRSAGSPPVDLESFQTIQDPRTASMADLSRRGSDDSRQTGHDMEVAALSDKLISAINHQQNLDDALSQARHELEEARKELEMLRARENERQERERNGGVVSREEFDKSQEKMRADLTEANRQKNEAQQAKRAMEGEVETLTASLFENANKMVSVANRERDATEKKNQQLRDQIRDEGAVIASQNEQLTELKSLMSQIQNEHRKELQDSPRVSLGPGTPKAEHQENDLTRLLEALDLEPVSDGTPISPSAATTFTHLVKPQCRTDVPAYDEFRNMLETAGPRSHQASHTTSRAGSGSYGGLNVMGISAIYNGNNSSSPNIAASATSKLAQSPQVPGSFSPNSDRGPSPLKETKFFKRLLNEDIEPALRLDLSPSITWLGKRSILSAFVDSTLIAEPISDANRKLYGRYTACSLCGENRKEGQNPRTHVMRVREGEGATKWPICQLCLEKVRAVGDLVGYVRMIRDGVVKTSDLREENEVWDELVRLREKLFWARMAGGVVPAFIPSRKNSPVTKEGTKSTNESPLGKDADGPVFETPMPTPRTSEDAEGDEATKQATAQLQAGLEEVTTFDNAKEHALKRSSLPVHSTPPNTPPRKRESGGGGGGSGFPKINIPRLPASFWEQQVNTLH